MAGKVFLVGFMGCGKSTLGRRLALRLGCRFVDTDTETESRAGMPIPEIFATRGEEWFRSLEKQVIDDAASAPGDVVVALGGGAPCREGVMEILGGAGTTVYLKNSPQGLVNRMNARARARRPKIAGLGDDELLAYIEKTLPEREKYYNKATFVVDSASVSDETIVRLLVEQTNRKMTQKI